MMGPVTRLRSLDRMFVSRARENFRRTARNDVGAGAMAFRIGIFRLLLGIACLMGAVPILVLHFANLHSNDVDMKYRKSIPDISKEHRDVVGPNEGDFANIIKRKDDHSNVFQIPKPDTEEEAGVLADCGIKHKDALSAINRAKTIQCKNKLAKVACLLESGRLDVKNITRLCPVDRSLGRPAHSVGQAHEYGPPIRIAFILSVHGRALRQLKRLFIAIYHPHHYYYFHVDSRSHYLHREVRDFIKLFPNTALAPWRMATIWGGASLLKMLLTCMDDLLKKTEWKWDFFINLSESDYPVQTNAKLAKFLRGHRDENFLKPHGGPVERFIKKQGIDRTFYECDEHMWRIGDRKIPPAIDIDGGSDWIALNRKFCEYVLHSEDSVVTGLKLMYKFALLPAESFFHTVLRNSPLCETFVKSNLRLTNWKRKLGCRCQHKHVVDWCGCSPNDFKPEDFPRLQSQTLNAFARKFEAVVNQEIINMLDAWLYGEKLWKMPGLHSYWENVYNEIDDDVNKYDVYMTFYQSFARQITRRLAQKSTHRVSPIWKAKEAHYYTHRDTFQGVLVKFDAKIVSEDGTKVLPVFETWAQGINMSFLYNQNMSEPGSRLKELKVGLNWDQKERVFRNFAGMIGTMDTPTLVHRWVHGKHFYVRIVWIDPMNVVAGIYQMKVEENWVISFHKPTFKKPLRPGTWKVKLVHEDNVVLGETSFLVTPLAYVSGKALTLEDSIKLNNGPGAGLYTNDFVIDFDREANDTEARVKEFSDNSHAIGRQLEFWIDLLIARHWVIKDTCIVDEETLLEDVEVCRRTTWSSLSADPKSDVSKLLHKKNAS